MAAAMPMPLPRSVIEEHLRRIKIDDGEFRDFTEIVVAIDDFFVEDAAARISADVEKDAAKNKGR